MVTFDQIKQNFPAIHKAAGEFILKLSMEGIENDIALAAEMAGLMMLRASKVDLSTFPPGTALLGAVSDEAGSMLFSFILTYGKMNGVDTRHVSKTEIPAQFKSYLPELTQYEPRLHEVCKQNGVTEEFYPIVAATTAVKLVLAGKTLKVLDEKLGLALIALHVITGSKTIPYPAAIGEKPV